jgi:hypothetical protein
VEDFLQEQAILNEERFWGEERGEEDNEFDVDDAIDALQSSDQDDQDEIIDYALKVESETSFIPLS